MTVARYKFNHLDSNGGDNVTELKSIAYEEWQRRWDASSNGRDTYIFFKDVKERSNMDWFQPQHNLVQVVSGHGNFKEYLVKQKIAQYEECGCGEGSDNPHHFIFTCLRWEAIRESLKGVLGETAWTEMEQTPDMFP